MKGLSGWHRNVVVWISDCGLWRNRSHPRFEDSLSRDTTSYYDSDFTLLWRRLNNTRICMNGQCALHPNFVCDEIVRIRGLKISCSAMEQSITILILLCCKGGPITLEYIWLVCLGCFEILLRGFPIPFFGGLWPKSVASEVSTFAVRRRNVTLRLWFYCTVEEAQQH